MNVIMFNLKSIKYLTKLTLFILILTIINQENTMANEKNMKRIVLLGASVGKGWKIEQLSERLNKSEYIFEYVGEYQFDKTEKLLSLFSKEENKPDAIILKECAAYFPGNFSAYQNLVTKWIYLCRKNDINPILATVIPVRNTGIIESFKEWIKRDILKRETRQEAILKYNDWIRKIAAERNLAVLDLEKALRISDGQREMSKEFDNGDGLHINKAAYEKLDNIVIPTLKQIWKN